jgi:hypothetical protein
MRFARRGRGRRRSARRKRKGGPGSRGVQRFTWGSRWNVILRNLSM